MISYAGVVGTYGADVVSVDEGGNVALWDSKYRSGSSSLGASTTFTPGSTALNDAVLKAQNDIENSALPQAVKDRAIQNSV